MPRIAVITPYFQEPLEMIRRCHDSVLSQGADVHHILLADGHRRSEIDQWQVTHLSLPPLADWGNTPRMIGAAVAAAQRYEGICFLDADNWFEPEHVQTLFALAQTTKAAVVTCARMLRRPDGSALGICTESDGARFNDTNCYLLLPKSFALLGNWCFQDDPRSAPIGDRYFWRAIVQSGLARHHSPLATINYVTRYFTHYLQRGEVPPPGARTNVLINGVVTTIDFTTWQAMQTSRSPP